MPNDLNTWRQAAAKALGAQRRLQSRSLFPITTIWKTCAAVFPFSPRRLCRAVNSRSLSPTTIRNVGSSLSCKNAAISRAPFRRAFRRRRSAQRGGRRLSRTLPSVHRFRIAAQRRHGSNAVSRRWRPPILSAAASMSTSSIRRTRRPSKRSKRSSRSISDAISRRKAFLDLETCSFRETHLPRRRVSCRRRRGYGLGAARRRGGLSMALCSRSRRLPSGAARLERTD